MFGALLTAFLSFQSRSFMHKTNIVPSDWIEIGKPLSSKVLEFGLLLPQNNIYILEVEVTDRTNPNSDLYGKWLSPFEIDTIISSDTKDFDVITDWLSDTITSYGCINNLDSVYCKTTVENINKLFNTEMLEYQNKYTKTIFYSGRKMGYSIPSYLDNIIELVIGIGDYPEHSHKKMKLKKPEDGVNYISPLSLQLLYNMSNYGHTKYFKNVGSQSVVEFQNDDCFNIDDLNRFLKDNELGSISFKNSSIIGDCDLHTQFPDIEASLDIQYQLGVNTNTEQMYVSVPDWLYQFANMLYNLQNPPLVNSMSYGWAEHDQCDPMVFPECYISGDAEIYSKRTNVEFMKLALRGITLLASSGDAGAAGRTNEGCDISSPLNPVFPTSSPYVLSVGGTIVMNSKVANSSIPLCKENNCISGGNELNCNFDRCGWTSGGGFSNFFNRPWWQETASKSYLNSKVGFPPRKYFNRNGRVYPDIALVSHNYLVQASGNYMAVDGTSASSPAISGMISILNNLRFSQNKPSLGLVGPLLYDMYVKCPLCFKDILEGSNNSTEQTDCKYGYTATKGFDAVYGLGLPNFDTIYSYVKNMQN
jgi:subtilase family serine protease